MGKKEGACNGSGKVQGKVVGLWISGKEGLEKREESLGIL